MRLSTRAIALCVGLLVTQGAAAAQLPQRWVSAGGALSEWVSALGAQAKLVGVDTTSQHPESLKALPSIGYQRQLSAEGILSLRPQILIGTEEMGPPPVLSQIRSAGVQVELFSAQPDLPTLQNNLQHLGRLLGSEAQATALFEGYQQQLAQQQVWVRQAQASAKAPGVLLLLGHAGGKPFSVESLAGLAPDVLVFSDRALAGDAARAALFKQNPILATTPAAKVGRVLELDPTLLVGGLGPRLPQSLVKLSAGFYPAESAKATAAQ
ncbi:heme/hemin ABC transporter substrate-binding protein [Pseudomonas sp. RA_35y_Pfl2_P32]|uniref:heme/hemin ABC transporter substrate-binding protein n=1 Tax=Pseudomonas sp. RA_35y_Pfl2_P32 TaxID=3088705 RepID=UPI0030DBC287